MIQLITKFGFVTEPKGSSHSPNFWRAISTRFTFVQAVCLLVVTLISLPCLGIPSGLFHWNLPINILYAFLRSSMRAENFDHLEVTRAIIFEWYIHRCVIIFVLSFWNKLSVWLNWIFDFDVEALSKSTSPVSTLVDRTRRYGVVTW